MYDSILDHELDEDSAAADVEKELSSKADNNIATAEESQGLTLGINNTESKEVTDVEDETVDLESWSDDPVRMYLTQMGEIPLLTRQEEINLARRIETTRTSFRRRLLACDFVIRAAYKILSRVHRGELPFDRTVQVSVTDRLEKEQILGRLPHNLRTIETLLQRNEED